VAARLTIDFLRKLPAPASEFPEAANFDDPDPSELLISEEQEKLFADAVQSLSARDRILIELSFREGLPPEEIAAILKTTVGAVYTQKSRILDKLREFLKTPHP
jgi:RNA polymerase sigma factor (sigma-70 family)